MAYPRKPAAILKLQGTYRADRHEGREVPAPIGRPECPPDLSVAQRDVWDEIVSRIEQLPGVLSTVDGAELERYCVYAVRWRECEAFISKEGLSYVSETGVWKEYPEVSESHRLHAAMRETESRYGLNPLARTKIRGSATDDQSGLSKFTRNRSESNVS